MKSSDSSAPSAERVAPGPRRLPAIGNLAEFGRKDMIAFYLDAWRQHGDLVRFQLGPMVAHLVVHPDDVKRVLLDNVQNYPKGPSYDKIRRILGNGLVTADGSLWRRQRRLLQPPFTPRAVEQFAPAMVGATTRMLDAWEEKARDGAPVEVNGEMMRLAMSIIARTMLSMDIGERAVAAAQAVTEVLEFVSHRSVMVFDLPLAVPTPGNLRFRRALYTLDNFILGVVAERRRDPNPPDDLLTRLINSRDQETGQSMSLRQIRDEVVTIFFAGHETTAQALTWTWFLLDRHPEVASRLHDEVDRALGGRLPSAADLPALDYVRMVVQEAMRLYPPVWVVARTALAADMLAGYDVPAGSMVTLSPFLTHRHPEFWPDPERFDPDRFSADREETRHRFAYFPFIGGPRVCLGNSFALLEATIAVAMVAQRFRLSLVPGQTIAPKMVGTLRPNGPVMMKLEAREHALAGVL